MHKINHLKIMKFLIYLMIMSLMFLCKKKEDSHSHQHMQHEGYPRVIKDAIKCDVHSSVCNFELELKDKSRVSASLDLSPKPVYAMKDIEFTLQLKPEIPEAHIMLDLTMPAMYMGENKVEMKEISSGVFKAKSVFAECTTDDRLWNIEVMIHLKNGDMIHKNIQFDIKQ